MLNLSNKKYLYSNGSSISSGGGFEEIKYRTEIRNEYEKKGIKLPDTQLECSFPFHLSQNLGLELVNEAKSGLGMDGVIRKTYNWISKNSDKLEETIFILEMPVGIRMDWWVEDWDDFGILNAYKTKDEFLFTLAKEWFIDDENEQKEWNKKYESTITEYFNKFFDTENYKKIEENRVLFFVSYLNQMNIDYYISLPVVTQTNTRRQLESIVPPFRNINNFLKKSTLWRYCQDNNWLIENEIDFADRHLGYFGSQNIAKLLTKFILNKKDSI